MTLAQAQTDTDTLIRQAELARDRGRLAEGRALAERAWLELGADAGVQRRRVGLLLLHFRYRSGALVAVLDLAQDVLPLLRASGPTGELIDALRIVTLCAADTNRFSHSLACAQEAHRLALEIDDRARLSLATNALACFFERAGDPWQAERLMLEALSLGRSQPDPQPVFAALNNLGAVLIGKFHLLRDAVPLEEAREALRMAQPFAQEAVALARQGSEDFYKVFTLANLGEILVHLGQADAAEKLLDEATATAAPLGYEALLWRLGCAAGELQLLRNQPEQAMHTLSRLLQASAHAEQRTTHLRLHHAMWRAADQLGRTADALHHLQQTMALERQRVVTQLRTLSDLFVTRMEAEQVRQEAQRHRARASALEADVLRDELTGLGNRREMETRWPELIRQAQASGSPLSVAMLDLDHFKQVNDRHGHAVGDQVLVALAGLLRAHTRAVDWVVRLGGEEFLLVLPDTGTERAAEVCERLRQCVAGHDWNAIAPGLRVTLSIGLTSAPPVEAQTLSLRADAALYRAKAAGRNCLVQM
jgi:diguanylate cyclase (GGDEF)-like protein